MIFDKRRFQRVPVDFDVELFSATKVPVGQAKAIDLSTSGLGVKSNLSFQFRKSTEIFISFKLPDDTFLEKIRVEIRGVDKLEDGFLLKLRFTEMKVLDIMKSYLGG
ncbi:MAG: PilZ domain-containing protein [Candidatus Firestonebacteria bacterium]